MNLLILGGTVFVGRGVAEAALARGHRVTLFHRGRKGKNIVSGADEILGDRDGGLDALKGREWDAVVDACGYVPRVVRDSAKFLSGVGRYLFVSTISVYEEDDAGGLRVNPVETPVDTEEVNGESYGPLKVECERVVQSVFGERATIVRPGLVYGPYDPTSRFPDWVTRFIDGGEIVVPDMADAPLQQIDARDLGLFMVLLLEKKLSGVFDAVGEDSTFGETITACHRLNLAAQPVYERLGALEKAGVRLGADLPLTNFGSSRLMKIEPSKALAAGLERRPMQETILDTAEWIRTHGFTETGLSREREIEVLASLSL